MGLFSRRRVATLSQGRAIYQNTLTINPGWLADTAEIEVCPAYLMDEECAGDHAFGARFTSVSAPGSVLTIWAFPAECGPAAAGYWFVGYKTEYEWQPPAWAGDPRRPAVSLGGALYHGNVACAEWYGDLDTATEAARTAAASLVILGRHANAQHVPAEVIDAWFGWDGEAW